MTKDTLQQLSAETAAASTPAPAQPDTAALLAQIAALQAQIQRAQHPELDPIQEQKAAIEAEISALQVTYARYAMGSPIHHSVAELTLQRDRLKAYVECFESLFGKR